MSFNIKDIKKTKHIMYKMKTIEFKFKKHVSQTQLFKEIPEEKIGDWFLFAADKMEGGGQKTFSAIKIAELWKVEALLGTDNHIYEWIPENIKIKPYFDCEMEGPEFTNEESFERIKIFIDFVCREMNLFFSTNLTENSFIILNSCRKGKLSYHLIVNDTFYFECMEDHKNFIQWLNSKFVCLDDNEKNLMSWKKTDKAKDTHEMKIFDNLVYSKNQKIRCINQSKKGKYFTNELKENVLDDKGNPLPITLVNREVPVLDTLIGLYQGVGDRRKINGLSLQYDLKETVKSVENIKTNKKTNKTVGKTFMEENYIITGETLMVRNKIDYKIIANYVDYKQYLYLIPNSNQDYQFYNTIAFMLFQIGADVSLFVEWAKLYHSYNKNCQTIKNYAKQTKNPAYSATNFLRKYAKISNPDYFNTEERLLHDYYNPLYYSMLVITEKSHFVSQVGTDDEKNIECTSKIILIQADLGAGKTTAIKRVLMKNKYSSVLIITPRIAYAEHVVKEFGVQSYLTGKFDENCLACSVESFHRIPDTQYYDCVILDECEAILSIFSSPTLKNRQFETYQKLKKIIEKSQKVFFAGAFITQKTIDFIQSFNTTSILIKNMRISPRKQAIEINPEAFHTKLINYIDGGGKPYVYWDSKKQADDFINQCRGFSMNNENMKNKLDNMIFYNSDSDDEIFRGLADINEVWNKASFVMATPSITVGNSYCPAQTTFTSVWIFGFPTCIVADTIQGHKRVRHTTTNNLYFCVPEDSLLKLLSGMRGNVIQCLADFDVINDEKRQMVVNFTQKRIEKINKTKHNDETIEQYDAIIRALTNEYQITPLPLRRLLFQNLLENELSKKYFTPMFFRFLDICGYDIISSKKKDGKFELTKEEKNEIERNYSNAIEERILYSSIESIDFETKEKIQKKIHTKTSTLQEKLQVYKFFFDLTIDDDLTIEVKQLYFTHYIDNNKRRVLNNLYKEANNLKEVSFLQEFQEKNIITAENLKFESLKLGYIRAITKKLGLSCSWDNDIFQRGKLEKIGEYLFKERQNIHKVFKLRDQSINFEISVKNSLNILEKVFKSWHGGYIKKGDIKGEYFVFAFPFYNNPSPYKLNINNEEQIICRIEPSLAQAFNEIETKIEKHSYPVAEKVILCVDAEKVFVYGMDTNAFAVSMLKPLPKRIPLKHKTMRFLTFTPIYD